MGSCKTCKHWGGDDLTEAGPQTCNRIAYHSNAEHGCGEPAALSAMCEEEAGELITEPTFGCALHELKPEPELSKEAEEARRYCG